jgi:SNF2 family DNA or RNA helicase
MINSVAPRYSHLNTFIRKTLQTISLLSYLASYKGIWGPHIVIVPTSVILNWETELKRFCPGLKVLCYYGSAKRRKELRTGWTKANWYHVVITSYQLAVQDAFAFKRKKWYYMILDEAHNIKNFQSQRWQTLISFNSQRRLLLTGTPLQNNLTELWSLLHFLMPHVFRSRKEFSYWFSNPMNNIIEGNSKRSDDLISRLHGIIRPFVLRRLKKDVETQLPGKYEHIVKCQMSRRQMFLYEEFMARSSTRASLTKGGNFMGMMNVLMQLRKVCNHPDLFEPRAVITPFAMDGIDLTVPDLVVDCLNDQSSMWKAANDHVRVPIWCGSTGLVSPSGCLEHDTLVSQQLSSLATSHDVFVNSVQSADIDEPLPENGIDDKLARHLKGVWHSAKKEKYVLKASQSRINMLRCNSNAFCFPGRLQDLVTLEPAPLCREAADVVTKREIVSTPKELLALRRSNQARGEDVEDAIKKFVFCIPKAGAAAPRMGLETKGGKTVSNLNDMLLEPLEQHFLPFQKARARLSSFFPDKRLIQFDAGKLQTLAGLLHNLKRGRHRVLIFTQMSKMLDVLEAFLNLNGHTYLRLDGSTGVERRQRLMDKFNNDEKVFCFILSTRSGGLGINLTGADTVVFYDSDWNPAMDVSCTHQIRSSFSCYIISPQLFHL